MLFVVPHLGGCNNLPKSDYCIIAQKPFQWRDADEIMATPTRPLRYIEEGALIYEKVCD